MLSLESTLTIVAKSTTADSSGGACAFGAGVGEAISVKDSCLPSRRRAVLTDTGEDCAGAPERRLFSRGCREILREGYAGRPCPSGTAACHQCDEPCQRMPEMKATLPYLSAASCEQWGKRGPCPWGEGRIYQHATAHVPGHPHHHASSHILKTYNLMTTKLSCDLMVQPQPLAYDSYYSPMSAHF